MEKTDTQMKDFTLGPEFTYDYVPPSSKRSVLWVLILWENNSKWFQRFYWKKVVLEITFNYGQIFFQMFMLFLFILVA